MKKSIYYWSPCLTKVGTVKSTINSAISLAKYSKSYNVKILNVFGEWSKYKDYLKKKNVEVEDLAFNYYNFLPKNGFLNSRFSYLTICFISLIPLIIFLKRKKPDFLILHLITSLPLILLNILKFKSQIILRISGYPKLNYLRRKLWIYSGNKIFAITCPTQELKKELIDKQIFQNDKVKILFDAIINIEELIDKKIDKNLIPKTNLDKGYFLSAGRFTKQKNYIYLIKEFKKFLELHPNEKLVLIGEGELEKKIKREITNCNLKKNIMLLNYTDNIYYYMKNSKAFILSSLWEEVGFVIVEAAVCNTFVISSNCKNGPKEFLMDGKAGLLFENNENKGLFKKLKDFKKLEENEIYEKKVLAKKNSVKFSMFRHFLSLKNIIEKN